ncbi:MAG: c-type cytochrome [Leptospiraceae bacterium]|nr:c-type cytochrome [Leptospiraceae bacterium]
MRKFYAYSFLSLVVLSLLFILNCGKKEEDKAQTNATNTSAGSDLVAKGKEVYEANCASCHGPNGAGDGPAGAALNPKPRNFLATDGWKNGKTKEGILKTLKEGIAGSGMVAYPHLEADHEALAEFVLSLK